MITYLDCCEMSNTQLEELGIEKVYIFGNEDFLILETNELVRF